MIAVDIIFLRLLLISKVKGCWIITINHGKLQ